MDIISRIKKNPVLFTILILIAVLVLVNLCIKIVWLTGTLIVQQTIPPDPFEKGRKWVSTDPNFVIEFADIDGAIQCKHRIVIDGKTQYVDFGTSTSYFYIFEPDSRPTKKLITGSFDYRNGDLVFYIEEDDIDLVFNHKYSEIVFKKER